MGTEIDKLVVIRKELFDILKDPNGTYRLTKGLQDGRIVIFQIVNPQQDPKISKWLRKKSEESKTIRLAHAIETSQRVARCVFRSILRKQNK